MVFRSITSFPACAQQRAMGRLTFTEAGALGDDLVAGVGKHTCGLTGDHSAVCWGNDENGQVTPPDWEFASVSAGTSHPAG